VVLLSAARGLEREQMTYDDWVEQNPLRRWRKGAGLSIMRAAVTLEVTVTTIQSWERGAVTPSHENFERIADTTGTNEAAWTRWSNRRPNHEEALA
jgi:transcriptional regulator with XRE-family HTH domain